MKAKRTGILSWRARRSFFIGATLTLLAFGMGGQLLCDWLGYEKKFIYYLGINVLVTCIVSAAVYFTVSRMRRGRGLMRVAARSMAVLYCLWVLTVSVAMISNTQDHVGVYSAGWWIGLVDKLEDERRLWSVTRWFGRGDAYYEYDDSALEITAQTEAQAMEEPYHSALDERARADTVYDGYRSDTMLGVLSYCYGRWVWCLYVLLAVAWTVAGIWMFFAVVGVWERIAYLSAFISMLLCIWLPAADACGVVYAILGPPFTGCYPYDWQFNALIVGPCLGAMPALGRCEGRACEEML